MGTRPRRGISTITLSRPRDSIRPTTNTTRTHTLAPSRSPLRLSRQRLVHYVDDYGSINTKQDAESSFQTFAQLNSILGFHMKPSKEQRPANEHKIQGVIIQCETQQVSVKPCPNRIQRLLQELHNHLHTNNMTPEEARRLAGKCSFTTTHLFGRVGRAPLRALYDKSHSTTSIINNHTRTAIIALREILAHCLPKTIPLHPEPKQITIVYTDAFFSDGNTQFRNSDFSYDEARPDFDYDHTNGWAAVIFPPGRRPTIIHGSVPRKILQHFASNKAYIYILPGGMGSHHHPGTDTTITYQPVRTTMRQ